MLMPLPILRAAVLLIRHAISDFRVIFRQMLILRAIIGVAAAATPRADTLRFFTLMLSIVCCRDISIRYA